MARGKRKRIATNVYRDRSSITARVWVHGLPKDLTFPVGTALADIRKEMTRVESERRSSYVPPGKGTLTADAEKYRRLIQHLASRDERWCEVRAWVARYPTMRRRTMKPADVLTTRAAWLQAGIAPKTVNNRVFTLKHWFRTLDGPRVTTPADDIAPLPVPRTPIERVSAGTILAVDTELQAREAKGLLRSPKTRARFRVLVATGRRPCEIMRAQPLDVNLEARVWVPRDAKGGHTPGIYLNDDMVAAWELFIAAEAWGRYETSAFANTLRAAGWPAKVRPYQARHSYGIALSEAGVDLDDVGTMLGHKRRETTRRHYVPVLNSRLEAASRLLDGRFQGFTVTPHRGTSDKPPPENS